MLNHSLTVIPPDASGFLSFLSFFFFLTTHSLLLKLGCSKRNWRNMPELKRVYYFNKISWEQLKCGNEAHTWWYHWHSLHHPSAFMHWIVSHEVTNYYVMHFNVNWTFLHCVESESSDWQAYKMCHTFTTLKDEPKIKHGHYIMFDSAHYQTTKLSLWLTQQAPTPTLKWRD